ncbi:MULE transposase domain [Arabidopsis thaliana x Arabidopsis arenosa]|uniref:MULE transposase domain n=1 Tax=Arabidopsis thaliana x Arabidopsis arenosa TaxID=1240361 RepID=A0A8T1ZK34_9BRAS|nr:MULE transposase domain [Arabidopsis thaliana x Arabidopsis arenosa]
MDEGVMILVGCWECKESGEWRFKMSAKKYAKCVDVSAGDTIADVEQKIATAFGVDRRRTKMELSFWFEGGDTVYTQQKMPPVSVDSESSLSKFKKIRIEKGGMNMYLCLEEDDEDMSNLWVEDDSRGQDMARPDRGDGESTQIIPVTFEEEDFLEEIYAFEESFNRKDVVLEKGKAKRGREEELVVALDTDSGGWASESEDNMLSEGEDSGDYDFDNMRQLIEREYPPDWDPWKDSRKKALTSAEDQYEGDERLGGQDEREGQNQPILVDVEVSQMDGREDDTAFNEGGEMAIQLGQRRMRQSWTTSQGWGRSEPTIGQVDVQEVSTDMGCNGEMSIQLVTEALGTPEGQNQPILVEVEVNQMDGRDDATAFVEGGEESGDMSIQLEQTRMRQGGTNFRRTECGITGDVTVTPLERREDTSTFNAFEEGEGEGEGDLEMIMGCSVGEESAEMGQIRSQLTLGETMFTELVGDDVVMSRDAAPFRDNAVGVAQDKANMNLRKAGDSIYIGQIFQNKGELHKALTVYSIKRLFNFRIKASDKTRVIAVCHDQKCHWRVYATFHENSENVEIRTASLRHSCDVKSRSKYGMKATRSILGELLKAKYAHGKKGPRACELPEIVLAELNVTISYMKAWNAKEMAMKKARGSEEESYKFLQTYLHLLRTTNPGTLSTVHTDYTEEGEIRFKYLFFAFGASVAGYKYLRKVIVIDGTQTKGKYKSCLVAASGQDGNYQIFPMAFGVIDSENIAGWTWFFKQLLQFVPDEEDLVFVSDRHAAIYAGLRTVYPLAKHACCTVHLFRNVVHHFKCEGLAKMVSNAARSYTVGDLRYWFEEIQKRDIDCANYLVDLGISHWTLAYFPGMRYNVMSSNISESLNAAMQKAIDFPIVTMVEFIRTMLMRWFCERREAATKTRTRCTLEIEEMLIDHLKLATDCAVIAASEWIYQVNDGFGIVFTVDLEKKTCTCRVFDVLMVPCCHALAAVGIRNVDIYSLIGNYAFVTEWRKLWRAHILPPPKEKDTEVPNVVSEVVVNPPKTRRPGGRPKTVRIPSRGEYQVTN